MVRVTLTTKQENYFTKEITKIIAFKDWENNFSKTLWIYNSTKENFMKDNHMGGEFNTSQMGK